MTMMFEWGLKNLMRAVTSHNPKVWRFSYTFCFSCLVSHWNTKVNCCVESKIVSIWMTLSNEAECVSIRRLHLKTENVKVARVSHFESSFKCDQQMCPFISEKLRLQRVDPSFPAQSIPGFNVLWRWTIFQSHKAKRHPIVQVIRCWKTKGH